jgi:hypothetical protein
MFFVIFGVRSTLSSTLFLMTHFTTIAPVCLVRSNSLIASALLFLVLLPQQVRLHAQHPRYTHRRQQQQKHLQRALASEHLVLGLERAGGEEHEDEHVEKAWGRHSSSRPVGDPFEDDAADKVAENGLKEEDLGNKFGPDIRGLFEVDVIWDLETDRKRHLILLSVFSGSASSVAYARG